MIKVGICGFGMMGRTHLDVYAKRDDVQVVAIADKDPKRLSGADQAAGNIEGQAKGAFSLADVKKYDDAEQLVADAQLDLVDVCLPTPLHLPVAAKALEAGRHVLVEKPLARTAADADKLVHVAAQAKGIAMPAMCMRFWPGWSWLKDRVDDQQYGKVLGLHFRRLSGFPSSGTFYSDGEASGGALLDLHVHDTDFAQYLFGMPKAVFSRGYSKITTEVDHLVTHYVYDDVPLVTADGGWSMANGFRFNMQYLVNFERATATFDLSRGNSPLEVFQDGEKRAVPLEAGMGYEHEIDYLLTCITQGKQPEVVTLADAARSVRIAEAERASIMTGQLVSI